MEFILSVHGVSIKSVVALDSSFPDIDAAQIGLGSGLQSDYTLFRVIVRQVLLLQSGLGLGLCLAQVFAQVNTLRAASGLGLGLHQA